MQVVKTSGLLILTNPDLTVSVEKNQLERIVISLRNTVAHVS